MAYYADSVHHHVSTLQERTQQTSFISVVSLNSAATLVARTWHLWLLIVHSILTRYIHMYVTSAVQANVSVEADMVAAREDVDEVLRKISSGEAGNMEQMRKDQSSCSRLRR
jgi:hypothetical protein